MSASIIDTLRYIFDIFIHLDVHLQAIVQNYGAWTYTILFIVIFCETGLVVTPFLPGDSLLFAAGSIASLGVLNPNLLVLIIAIAAVTGDSTNYLIGHLVGPRVFHEKVRFLKKEYLDKTHLFYEKHGGKTVILARFIPIIRTFSPFVAGVGAMHYPKFLAFSITGSFLWSSIFVYTGYFFGNIPFIKNNFTLVIVAIILISVIPAITGFVKQKMNSNKMNV
ncbi:MAG: DedA family protein, partial [FCB group bacterium]